MTQDRGASSGDDRATTVEPVPVSPLRAGIPSAGHNQPDWFAFAKAMAVAIMMQRGMRGVHVVGRNGKVTHGGVSLLGDYAVDDMARAFCDAAGIEFESLEPPTEHEAMFMLMSGMTWQDWLERPRQIRMEALGTGHPTKVDVSRLAQAIEARRAETGTGSVHESAVGSADAPQSPQDTPEPSTGEPTP